MSRRCVLDSSSSDSGEKRFDWWLWERQTGGVCVLAISYALLLRRTTRYFVWPSLQVAGIVNFGSKPGMVSQSL